MSDTTIAAKPAVINSVSNVTITNKQKNRVSHWERFKKMTQLSDLQGIFVLGVNLFVIIFLCGFVLSRLR